MAKEPPELSIVFFDKKSRSVKIRQLFECSIYALCATLNLGETS